MKYPSILDRLFINIAVLRRSKALTQRQLAEHIGVGNTTVSNWEKGVSCPQLVELIKLSNIFGVTLDSLVFAQHDEGGALPRNPLVESAAYATQAQINEILKRLSMLENDRSTKGKKAG